VLANRTKKKFGPNHALHKKNHIASLYVGDSLTKRRNSIVTIAAKGESDGLHLRELNRWDGYRWRNTIVMLRCSDDEMLSTSLKEAAGSRTSSRMVSPRRARMAPPGWSQGLSWGVGEGRDQLSEREGGSVLRLQKKYGDPVAIFFESGYPFFIDLYQPRRRLPSISLARRPRGVLSTIWKGHKGG